MNSIEKQLNVSNPLISQLPHLVKMILPMKEKFNKYWEPMKELVSIGLVLDPQYKMCFLRYSLEQQSMPPANVDNFLAKVRSTFLELWKLYVPAPPTTTISNPVNPAPSRNKRMLGNNISCFHQYMAGTMAGSPANAPGAELDLYLEERNMIIPKIEDFDILDWWGSNAAWFPSLLQLERCLLMIPMTSLASELAFSTGGQVLDDHRVRLNDE
jgi:hypothetical protein